MSLQVSSTAPGSTYGEIKPSEVAAAASPLRPFGAALLKALAEEDDRKAPEFSRGAIRLVSE